MPKFKKTILREDRDYASPDAPLSVTPESKKHWAAKVKEFTSKGFDIPVFWDHQDDPSLSQPVKRKSNGRRSKAKGQAGWLTSAGMSKDGGLEIELDIPLERDAEQVANNLTKVSPVIWDKLPDGRGKTHENVIGACDLVVHPVDDTQTDFKPAPAIACSLVRMNLEGKPTIYRLAEDDMADDDKTKSDDKDGEDTEHNEGDRVKRVIDALSAMQIVLPDDTSQENFFERVEGALLTAAAMGGDTMETGTDGLEQASPEFAALSLNSPLGKFASGQHRDKVANCLQDFLQRGKMTPAEYKTKTAALSTVRLSLDKDGNHTPTQVETWLNSREPVPDGTFWDADKRTRMAGLQEVPHPESLEGEITNERADEIADEVFGKR